MKPYTRIFLLAVLVKKPATYIPVCRSLILTPSCFLVESNTTVLAGMFTPIANVSVANRS